jgi:hypothetical protein
VNDYSDNAVSEQDKLAGLASALLQMGKDFQELCERELIGALDRKICKVSA